MADASVVECRALCREFSIGVERVRAVQEVELSVAAGELVCVYGASGSGKTTLVNLLAGIDVASAGSVRVLGQELRALSEGGRAEFRLRHIGVVFQTGNLLPDLTALDNVSLPLRLRGMSRRDARVMAAEAMAALNVADVAGRMPAAMSGGQRQRVGIARTLVAGGELVVADEPTGALDSENSRHLFALLRRAAEQQRVAVVLATHDPLAREVADVVYTMVDGRLSVA